MKTVYMSPNEKSWGDTESGIKRVIEAYMRYLPEFGWRVSSEPDSINDIIAVHAGLFNVNHPHHVAHCHGLYWTADYPAATWEWHSNAQVIRSLRKARHITVPSEWVAETIRRDMRINPHVIGHGIDLDDWGEPLRSEGYVLWNKNRRSDVCDPYPLGYLSRAFPQEKFVTTFPPVEGDFPNMRSTGVVAHSEMKSLVKSAGVYLATVKETFGIGILEAMASGVPVLGFRHGGILDLVTHGVNGYLAEVNNLEDLATGLAYCFENRKALGDNGRSIAQKYTWENRVEKVARVYDLSVEKPLPTCSVVIPTFNYGTRVMDAINSALSQDYPLLERVIVVDDGSTDDTGSIIASIRDPRVKYIHQENAGVAIARNTGIEEAWKSGSKYVCCLDADDKIDENFLTTCIKALEDDPVLGIAYTGLHYHKPNGENKLSKWPQEWDFDAQLHRKNQVPTCNVMRVEMWRRLGGYRQRYAPRGAGQEDAEFWTRCGAYGWKAEKVTDRGLFHYSWLSGQVSGDPNLKEVDWLAFHPWATKTGNGKHPFPSWANPANRISHPVRQYDEPTVSIIIPVGKNHVDLLWDALDSCDAQTFTKWEVIVVNDTGHPLPQRLLDTFPFIKQVDTLWTKKGPRGPGYARNRGVEIARGHFVLFLDADDYLIQDCLELMIDAWREDEAIVYTDYRGSAIIHEPDKLAPDLQKRLYQFDEKTGKAVIGYRSADYDCERAIVQPEKPFYHWTLVTCLVPKTWHDAVGGYDEEMESWEDVDYHYRLARSGYCFIKVAEELVVYRFPTGHRRQLGLEDHETLIDYMRQKYKEIETIMCGCNKGRSNVRRSQEVQQQRVLIAQGNPSQKEASEMADQDFVMIKYMHPNTGTHPVIGTATRTRYGMRRNGDQFLVDRRDVTAQSHLFVPVEERPVPTPPAKTVTPPPPSSKGWGSLSKKVVKVLEGEGFSSLDDLKGIDNVQLLAISGIGKATVSKIVELLA